MNVHEVVELTFVDPDLANELWVIYEAVGALETNTPFAQGLSRVQFDTAMVDNNALKLVIFDPMLERSPIALVIVSCNPDEVQWLSGRFFARYREVGREMRYIVGAASKRIRGVSALLNRLIDHMADSLPDGAVIFFDYSVRTHESMPMFAKRMCERNGFVVEVLDSMVFCSAERSVLNEAGS